MTVLPIYVVPQAVLKKKAAPITEINDDIKKLAEDMLDTMYAARGIGLAAPQIGQSVRLVVMDVEQDDNEAEVTEESRENRTTPAKRANPRIFINPEIIEESEEINVYQEGCLSIPGQYADVERPEKVTFKFLDINGVEQQEEADGLFATCIQHEIDHLDGVLFTDHISSLKRDMIMRKVKKWAKDVGEETKAAYVI